MWSYTEKQNGLLYVREMMKQTIFFILTLLILMTTNALADESACEKSPLVKGKCFAIVGSLYSYNGWSPYIRIKAENKKIYGVGPAEHELIPKSIRQLLPTQIEGQFELCPFGETTSVPYEKEMIEMVCIKSVHNAWYLDRKSGKKKKLK